MLYPYTLELTKHTLFLNYLISVCACMRVHGWLRGSLSKRGKPSPFDKAFITVQTNAMSSHDAFRAGLRSPISI